MDSWIPIANEANFIVVAPEFSEERGIRLGGDWEWRFNTGNVVSWFGIDVDPREWYFESVEQIFTCFLKSDDRVDDEYILFGHSAGGQFVHRMVLFRPDAHFDLAIAANSGWYSFPLEEVDFPYGLSGAPYSNEAISSALGRPLVVLLGTADTPDQGSFRSRPKAMRQGEDRIQRGANFFKEGQALASSKGIPFGWTLQYVEGVSHDYRGMALAAARLILGIEATADLIE
ncbi:MAG: hypothetical protein HQ519_13885 [Planctomycetes bacterium]|nr:hypothetical protein [Planctomycetota bacterium]